MEEGKLIIEYVGEVLEEEDAMRRMEVQAIERPLDHDLYVLVQVVIGKLITPQREQLCHGVRERILCRREIPRQFEQIH